jgi:pimeloyl-ACP methyl ester carboxylesterase
MGIARSGTPRSGAEAYRGGSGPPLVLLHGLMMSWRAWSRVLPELSGRHTLYAPTLPGHRGGPRLRPGEPVDIETITDAVERLLDEEAIDTAHLAGNSLGGRITLELARRGRARSVVALSPAGAWRTTRDLDRLHAGVRVGVSMGRSRVSRAYLHLPSSRRMLLRTLCENGHRLSVAEARAILDDMAGCTAARGLLAAGGQDRGIAPIERRDTADSRGTAITVAWGDHDRLIPFARYGAPMLERIPDAEYIPLPGAGHVPMLDDPAAVAATILAVSDRQDPERGRRT